MTDIDHAPGSPAPDPPRQPRRLSLKTAAHIATIVAAVVAVLAWWLPRTAAPEPADREATRQAGPSGPPTAGDPTESAAARPLPTGGPATTATVPLDTLAPVSGNGHRRPLPTRMTAAENPRAVVIGCPSNTSGDQTREVRYALNGRYLALHATVRPYFTSQPGSWVTVEAVVGRPQRIGTTLVTEVAGRVRGLRSAAGQPLAADTAGGVELSLRVSCEYPDGYVVLADARLTVAPAP
ncbi:MAG TPA: hypothetical protein VNV66_00500 [Pilimelia sp.]|nr:hypothetical protein [Pilimelia sp.]